MNLIDSSKAVLLVIDVQEKLVNMLNDNLVKENAIKICRACGVLNIDSVITEQYPKGLGETLIEIKEALPNAKYFEKTSFSAYSENGFKELISSNSKTQVIIFGIEAHICVLQTAFDLLNAGYEVFVVQDASGSRKDENKQAALRRLIHSGAQIITTEMVIFELLKSSKHPNFKEVQAIIK